jgi:hypothetical protein
MPQQRKRCFKKEHLVWAQHRLCSSISFYPALGFNWPVSVRSNRHQPSSARLAGATLSQPSIICPIQHWSPQPKVHFMCPFLNLGWPACPQDYPHGLPFPCWQHNTVVRHCVFAVCLERHLCGVYQQQFLLTTSPRQTGTA